MAWTVWCIYLMAIIAGDIIALTLPTGKTHSDFRAKSEQSITTVC